MSYKHYGERIIVQEIVEEKIGSFYVPQSAEGKSFRRGVVLSADPDWGPNGYQLEAPLNGKKIVYSVMGSIELEKGIFSVKEENVLAIIED
jgi:hypothetical protein